MSKCHSCVHADWRETTLACIACEGFSQWAPRSVPITIQPPVYPGHRDEGYDTLGVCGDGMETVDVVASRYEWDITIINGVEYEYDEFYKHLKRVNSPGSRSCRSIHSIT